METLGIGDVASHLGLDVDTLRWFERRGVVPRPERDSGGRRRYSGADVRVLEVLLHLRTTGMPLAGVAQFTAWVARHPEGVAERLALLTEHREQILAEQARTAASLAVIDHKIATYTELLRDPAPEHHGMTSGGERA